MRAFLFSTFDSTTREGEPLLDRIDLRSLQLFGFHGLGPGEKQRGQRFVIDATLYLPLHRCGMSDNLKHTVNYVSVLRDIERIMHGPSVNLIEHLAEIMCYRLLEGYPLIQRIQISIKKPDAPLPCPTDSFDYVGVTLFRKREDFKFVPEVDFDDDD